MSLLLSLYGRAKTYVIAGLTILAVIGGAYLKGRSDQKNSNENKDLKDRVSSLKKAREVSDEVRKMSPSDLDRELDRFMRD